MRAADRNPRTPNNSALSPAQRQLANLVRTLRACQAVEYGQTDAAEALAPALAAATWGPFGAFFVTNRSPHWAGVDHTYKTIFVQRRPVMTVRIWADGHHTVEKCFTPAEGEEYFQKALLRRRELAAQAAEAASRVRRLLGRATPAQRAYMYEASFEEPVNPLVMEHGARPVEGWEFDGSFMIKGAERLPAHAAVRATVSREEAARTVRDLQRNEERARAAGVARIGRGIAEAVWTALCLAREAEAAEAVARMRRIHA